MFFFRNRLSAVYRDGLHMLRASLRDEEDPRQTGGAMKNLPVDFCCVAYDFVATFR
jgi:hypothetical protein